MTFETQEQRTISVCADCAYFNAYGTLDDWTMADNPNAAVEHAAKIDGIWPDGTEFTSGCGRECPEHGIEAHGGDEEAYEEAYEEDGTDEWFSWSPCDECGSVLGGAREHATAWIPVPLPS
jgi:hypothetical protein